MNLVKLIRKLESQLKIAEKLSKEYTGQAYILRQKLINVANIVRRDLTRHLTSAAKNHSFYKNGYGLTTAGRARIIVAQHKRWAKYHASRNKKSNSRSKKGHGRLSPEGRAKIIEAQRRRWAAIRKTK